MFCVLSLVLACFVVSDVCCGLQFCAGNVVCLVLPIVFCFVCLVMWVFSCWFAMCD